MPMPMGSGVGAGQGLAAIMSALQKANVRFGVRGKNFAGGVNFGKRNRGRSIEELLAELTGKSQPVTPSQPASLPVTSIGGNTDLAPKPAGATMPPSFEALLRRRPSRGLVPMR